MRVVSAVFSISLLIAVGACASSGSDPLGDWMDRKFGPPQVAPASVTPGVSLDWPTARRNFVAALSRTIRPNGAFYAAQEQMQALRVRRDHFSFVDRGVVSKEVSTSGREEPYSLRRVFRYRDVPAQVQITRFDFAGQRLVPLWGTPVPNVPTGASSGYYEQFRFANQDDAEAFVRALYDVIHAARVDDSQAGFEQLAAAWRAANPRPRLSDAANRERVLAEAAVRGKNYDEAIEHFEAALETDPTWSSGNYNLALLYGETEDYGEALRYMNRFLLLEPNSREAPAAREKMIVWEDKASHPSR